MAHFNSLAPRKNTKLHVNPMQPVKVGRELESRPLDSFTEIPRSQIGAAGIRQHLEKLADSDACQVVLVPPAQPDSSGDSNSSIRVLTTQIVLLPLTWRDISRILHGATRESALGPLPMAEVSFGEVSVDIYRMRVTRRGEDVVLTAMEFKVLRFFVTNPGRVISREELLNEVWGDHNYPSTRTVDNHILKLRQKLVEDPADPIHFRTVHSVGYRFVV